MPVKFNATVDGVNDVPRPSGSSSVDFDDGRINYYSAFEDSDDLVARFRLEGADWKIRLFRVSADENQGFTNTTIIKDQDNASGRRIDFLSLGQNSEVDLKSTRVKYIEGWEGTEHDISLGSEFTNYITLGAATNRVTVGTGDVGTVSIYDGRLILKIDQGGSVKFVDGDDKNDIVNVSQGRIDALRLSEGADKVTVSSTGRIDYVEAFNGKKDFILSGEGRIGKIDTGDGNKLTTVKLLNNARINNLENFNAGLDLDLAGNARVGTLRSGDTTRVTDVDLKGNARIGAMDHYDGDSDISIKGNARINSLNAGEGDINITATGNGHIGSTQLNEGNHTIITDDGYFSIMEIWRGKVDLTIGQGGAGSIRIDSDAVNSHKAKFDGYVESLHISDRNDDDSDDQSINLVIGQDGSGKIETGNGNDRVTVKGYVNFLSTRDGDDRVVINTNEGSERVNLGDGDDTILVSKFAGDRGILIAGRGGSDTIDFSLYGKSAVVFDLDTGGAYQNPGAKNGNLETQATGYILETGVDNIFGAKGNDQLTGDQNANLLAGRLGRDRLEGLGGNDTLEGGGGNDRLIGGAGRDLLKGGAGADRFEFAKKAGIDRIEGFKQGEDKLRILSGDEKLGDLGIQTKNGNLVVNHDGGQVTLLGQGGITLTVDDVLFS